MVFHTANAEIPEAYRDAYSPLVNVPAPQPNEDVIEDEIKEAIEEANSVVELSDEDMPAAEGGSQEVDSEWEQELLRVEVLSSSSKYC